MRLPHAKPLLRQARLFLRNRPMTEVRLGHHSKKLRLILKNFVLLVQKIFL
jgi:hypothetical protein